MKRVFGRSHAEFPLEGEGQNVIVLSYDIQQFQWAEGALIEGSLQDAVDGKGVVSVYRDGNMSAPGSFVKILMGEQEQEVPVTGVLGDVPYNYGLDADTGQVTDLVICSEEMFQRLTGETGYAVLTSSFAGMPQTRRYRRYEGRWKKHAVPTSYIRTGGSGTRRQGGELLHVLISVWIPGSNCADWIFQHHQQYCHERVGADEGIRSHARRRHEYRSGDPDGGQRDHDLYGFRSSLWVHGGNPAEPAAVPVACDVRWGDAWSVPGRELMVIVAVMAVSACLASAGPVKQIRKLPINLLTK